MIHPTAIIDSGAEIASDVEVGPYSIIGAGAVLHSGVKLKSHVVVEGQTHIGARTVVYPYTVLGGPGQHQRAKCDQSTLVIGEDCTIREQVSLHRGTELDDNITSLGDRVFVMSAAHIGHDCRIEDDAIIASNVSLGGHVKVGASAFLGGLVGVHQGVRIGHQAYIGGCAAVAKDVIPYASVVGNRAVLGGFNLPGLKRQNLSRETLRAMVAAFRALFLSDGVFRDRVELVEKDFGEIPQIRDVIEFIRAGGARPVMGASSEEV